MFSSKVSPLSCLEKMRKPHSSMSAFVGFSKEARQARRGLNALKAEADLEEAKARVAVAKAAATA